MKEGMSVHMPWDGMWNGMMGGWGGVVMLLWVTFSVVLLVLVVLGVVWLARNLGSGAGQAPPRARSLDEPTSAREVLDLRYARGEIGRDEYFQARRDLEDRSG